MINLPEGAELLRIAREALLRDVKPLLEGKGGYTLAMIANAMAIAAREAHMGDARALEALGRLDRIYERAPRELHGPALRNAILEDERRLTAEIRAGLFDADDEKRRAVLTHLLESVRARLAVSNPKYLDPGLVRDQGRE